MLKVTVNINGNSLNKVGTWNSVFNIISCKGCINNALSKKKPEPKPTNISFVI